jgi:hypothetical protein
VTSLDQKNGLSWLISNRFSLQAVNHAAHYWNPKKGCTTGPVIYHRTQKTFVE